MMLKYVFPPLLVGLSVLTTGCGGSGGGSTAAVSPATVTLSGKVADLNGAKVCLDINEDKICNTGEPADTSKAGGAYSIAATQAQIDASPVVAEASTATIDEGAGTAVTKKYTLSAPAGKGAFVSPLTTMLHVKARRTGQTVVQVEGEMLASIGQSTSGVSMFDDYVTNEDTVTNTINATDYSKLHRVAQVTAATFGNNIETVETAIAVSAITLNLATALDSLMAIIVDEVDAQLGTISNEIDDAISVGTYDPATVAITVNAIVDTTTIESQVAVVEATTNATVSTFQQQLIDGFNWIWAEITPSYQVIDYGTITEASGALSESMYTYNFTSGQFDPMAGTADDVVLTASGWVAVVDDLSNCTIAFNADNSGTISCPNETFTVSVTGAIDVASLNIATFLANANNGDFSSVIDPAAAFSANATAYGMTFTAGTDFYDLWAQDSVNFYGGSAPAAVTLNDLMVPSAWVNDGISDPAALHAGFLRTPADCTSLCTLEQGLAVELVGSGTSGTANFYLFDYINGNLATGYHSVTKVATSTWNIQTINTVDILTYNVPASVKITYGYLLNDHLDTLDQQSIYSVYNGAVREGIHDLAGSVGTGEVGFDNIAIADIKVAITGAGSTAGLTCGYESGWDDLASGGMGAPITPNSFADYETVLADCGTAMPIAVTDVAGKIFVEAGAETFTFNDTAAAGTELDRDTGNFDDGQGMTFAFEWYVEAASCAGCTHSYVVVYTDSTIDASLPAGFAFRDTNALVGLTGAPGVAGSVYSFKKYSEQSNYGDMVRATGADGEIWTAPDSVLQ